MLNKKICWKCFQKERKRVGAEDVWFDKEFEHCWREGHTFCWGALLKSGHTDITKEPPELCPFILEHTVNKC